MFHPSSFLCCKVEYIFLLHNTLQKKNKKQKQQKTSALRNKPKYGAPMHIVLPLAKHVRKDSTALMLIVLLACAVEKWLDIPVRVYDIRSYKKKKKDETSKNVSDGFILKMYLKTLQTFLQIPAGEKTSEWIWTTDFKNKFMRLFVWALVYHMTHDFKYCHQSY